MFDIPESCDRIGVYAGLFYQPLFIMLVLVSIALNPGFELSRDALSDLGATNANFPWIFAMSLILSGSVGLVFAHRVLMKLNQPLNWLGVVLFIATILFIIVGVLPEDAPIYVGNVTLHKFITLVGFALASLVVVSYEIYWSVKKGWRHIGVPLLAVSILVTLVYYTNPYVSLAMIELATAFVIMMWSYSAVYYYLLMCGTHEDNGTGA